MEIIINLPEDILQEMDQLKRDPDLSWANMLEAMAIAWCSELGSLPLQRYADLLVERNITVNPFRLEGR